MKRFSFQLIILILLGFLVFLSFYVLLPHVTAQKEKPATEFSVTRAFVHVQNLAQHPHYVGSSNHSKVRNYIVGELQKMGLSVHTQNGYVVNSFKVLTNPVNIITQIDGSNPQSHNDLLVLAHYDSDPHSSYGASDDGAGIAAILEAIRALKAQHFQPKNNVIICITDAEEIGLLGAQLFAEHSPLVKNVGLVLNFEARGTSGPSNTIIETNHGNAQLVEAFAQAHPRFPMASSLMYEVYKNMPNDTDATVFREDKDIPSLFFAFIDGHYNYHTALDTPKNLSLNSLAHQGSYLMTLLPYFGNADISDLQTPHNQVYFNFPLLNLVHYSYTLIFPLLLVAWLGFIVLLILGFKRQKVTGKEIGKGFLAFLLGLVLCGLLGYFGWKAVLYFYPQYKEIQQGFSYNGHAYIAGFVALALAILWTVYHLFDKKENRLSLVVAPLVIWLLICTVLAVIFKGASYFIIPVLFLEIAFGLQLRKRTSTWLLLLCGIPAIFILTPLVVYVPVALGMHLVYGGLVLTALLFGLLPILNSFDKKYILAMLAFLVGVFFFVKAHMHSSFSEKNPKPNSLVYLLDEETHTASWNTYDHILDSWTKPYFKNAERASEPKQIIPSKYGDGFTYTNSAPLKPIPTAQVEVNKDTLSKGKIRYTLAITPQRTLNSLVLYGTGIKNISAFKANQLPINNIQRQVTKIREAVKGLGTRLLTYYPIDKGTLHVEFELPQGHTARLQLFGASYNLLHNPWIEVSPRDSTMIPRPFVLNDAVVVKQTIVL